MSTDGIIYVATRHDLFLQEAFLSALTVRQNCGSVPITLFTDRPGHDLCNRGVFDQIETVEGVSGLPFSWSAGILNRLRCLPRSPYQHSLYLDTDTLVLTRDLQPIFNLARSFDVAMAETSVDDSFSRQFFGRRMFNSG